MELSKRQWQVIREIAAEQARKVVKGEYSLEPAQRALELGFEESQIREINRIAGSTAAKAMKQADAQNCPVIYVYADEETRKVNEHLAAKLAAANGEIAELRGELTPLREELSKVWTRVRELEPNRRIFHSNAQASDSPATFDGYKFNDGDVCLTPHGNFTYFMGRWRRKSELEGFASAKKYL